MTATNVYIIVSTILLGIIYYFTSDQGFINKLIKGIVFTVFLFGMLQCYKLFM